MAVLPFTRGLCNGFVLRIRHHSLTNAPKLFFSHSVINEKCETIADAKHDIQKSDCMELNFRDPKVAHVSKSHWELIRGSLVMHLCSYSWMVKYNKQIMKLGRTILGKRLFSYLMKATFYGHFVGGETLEDVKPVARNLRKYGVKSIFDYSVEKDIEESEAVDKVKESLAEVVREPEIRPDAATKQFQTSLRFADRSKQVVGARTYFYESEYQCDKNMDIFIQSFDSISHTTEKEGFAAIKLTALGRPQLLLQMSDFLVQMEQLFTALVGLQFDAEEEPNQPLRALDLENFQKRLEMLGVQISYDENVHCFTLLDVAGDGVVDLLDWSHLKTFEYNLASIFTVKNRETGKTEQLVPILTEDGLEQMRNMVNRMDTIAKGSPHAAKRMVLDGNPFYEQKAIKAFFDHAKSVGIRVMIDAEQTYFQPAIRRLTMEMMRLFNRERGVIYGTYQCYLKRTAEYLRQDLYHAATEDFYFGAKLVRGAYMDQERARAASLGYEDPVNANYDATTAMFENCVDSVLQSITDRALGKVAVMIASHNEQTVDYALRKMKEFRVTPEQRQICFGQLYGMCDHLSFTLGQSGYSTFKYVPYGPVDEVLPYLSRRAVENSSMFSKTNVDLQLMRAELKRRLKAGELLRPHRAQ